MRGLPEPVFSTGELDQRGLVIPNNIETLFRFVGMRI